MLVAQYIKGILDIPKENRKSFIKNAFKKRVYFIEKHISNKANIISDIYKGMYRETTYRDIKDIYSKNFTETIYPNKKIKDIYNLKRLEFIARYKDEDSLDFLERVYPTKMPKEDYFPFADFDLDTEIPLLLTAEEKKRWNDDEGGLEIMSRVEVDKYLWCLCILWIDAQCLFITFGGCLDFYFKQVGKDTHLFEIDYFCT